MSEKQKYTTRADVVREVSRRTGIDQTQVKMMLEASIDVIKESIVNAKQPVQLRGFGTFFRKKRAEKTGRNISKGTTIKIPAHQVPAFKPSSEFADKVKNG